jgi:quinol-cytochrome oxidoreductase complex cytochrome b subunit
MYVVNLESPSGFGKGASDVLFFFIDSLIFNYFFSSLFISFYYFCLAIAHLLFLHQNGSNNPLGFSSLLEKLFFYPYFYAKDFLGFFFFSFFFLCLCFTVQIFWDILIITLKRIRL